MNVRARILQTACELFYREGIQAVGIQRLIDEAGIAKASLYAHFPSKDAVVAEYLILSGARYREHVQATILDTPLAGREKILRLFDHLCAWTAGPDFRGCPFQKARSEFPTTTGPVAEAIAGQRQWVRETVERLVRELGASDPKALAGSLIVLFDGAAATTLVDGSPEAAAHARWAVARLLDAAGAATGPKAPERRRRDRAYRHENHLRG